MLIAKKSYLIKNGRHDFQKWLRGHTFAVYVLPDLSGLDFDETNVSHKEYFHIRRANVKMWRRNRDGQYFSIRIMKPAISHPEFENGQHTPSCMKKYVEPVLRLVGDLYCARCRTPFLAKELWENGGLAPDQGQPSALLFLPILCWGKIFDFLGVLDTRACKLACLGLYRIFHTLRLRCKRRFCIDTEKVKQVFPE